MRYRLHRSSPVEVLIDAIHDRHLLRGGEPHEFHEKPPATTIYERGKKLLEVPGGVPHPGPQLQALFLRSAGYTSQITNKSLKYNDWKIHGSFFLYSVTKKDPWIFRFIHNHFNMSLYSVFVMIGRSMDPF